MTITILGMTIYVSAALVKAVGYGIRDVVKDLERKKLEKDRLASKASIPDSIKILILGRYNAGKSMMMRSLQGIYCQPSEQQTNGKETVKSFQRKINDKLFTFSTTVDISGNRGYHLAEGENESTIQKLSHDKDRIFFICDINEYKENELDTNIGKHVQQDVKDRLVNIAKVKPQKASLDVIFSHTDEIQDEFKRKEVEKQLEDFVKGYDNKLFEGVRFYEVNFMNKTSTRNLISQLFK